jgi:hypothetical protein
MQRDKRKGTLALNQMICRLQDNGTAIVIGSSDNQKNWKITCDGLDSVVEVEKWYQCITEAIDNVRNLSKKYTVSSVRFPQSIMRPAFRCANRALFNLFCF